MKFGVFTTLESAGDDHVADYRDMMELSCLAEELGYDNVWLAEHHGSNYGLIPSVPVAAAAVAQATERIRVGSLVTILPFMHPVRIAEEWAQVDQLSGGRVDLGLGRGYQPREFALMGANPEVSREVFAESLEIILGLWRNETFSFEGEHFTVTDASVTPRTVQDPHPPIWVAAHSPDSFKLVANHKLNIVSSVTLMTMPQLKNQIVKSARTLIELGRTPESIDFPISMMVHIAPSRAEAHRRAQSAVDWFFERGLALPGVLPGSIGHVKGYEFHEQTREGRLAGRLTTEDLEAGGGVIFTDPDGAVAYLKELRQDIGLKQLSAWMRFGGLAKEHVVDSMRLFADEVIPQLRDDTPVPDAFVSEEPPDFEAVYRTGS